MLADPYILNVENIKEAPTTFLEKVKYLGPGFILSASIVGSGELIATTSLGAKAGFVTFWVIILSCFVKVAVQIQFAKHTILSGETAMLAFEHLPGPKIGRTRWSVSLYFFLMLIKLLQVGGIIGGVALVMNLLIPSLPVGLWTFIIAPFVSLLVFKGYYRFIERFSLVLIAAFTIFTFAALYFLQYTEFAVSFQNILEGLTFSLPAEAVVFAIAAFGITGIGGDEIIYYSYWCLEKGYAAHCGPREDNDAWRNRVKGWIKVMYLDAILSMIFYTAVTAVFFLLGAAILHSRGEVPEGYQMLEVLSSIYTEGLGEGARTIFMIGAFVVLFSTLFAALAGWVRIFSDIFGRFNWIDFYEPIQRLRTISLLAWVFPLLWAVLFVFIKLPLMMVLSGGIAGSVMLLLVLYATIHFRYYRDTGGFEHKLSFDIFFWLSALSILALSVYGIVKLL